MRGWAARYSESIRADLARGYSYRGWALDPISDREEWDALEDYEREWYGSDFDALAYAPEARGYLPRHRGLCAFFASDRATAIAEAREDGRFIGMTLYVFPADFIDTDLTDLTAIVRAVGEAAKV